MNVFRGCATVQLLIGLLFVTSCVVGITSARHQLNPTHFTRHVVQAPDVTRRRLRDVFEPAVSEDGGPIRPDGPPTAIKLQDFTDGSIHLTAMQRDQQLLEVVARVLPTEDGESKVEIVSNAEGLAKSVKRGPGPEIIHRRIRSVVDQALDDVNDDRVMDTGLLVSRLVAGDKPRPRMRRYSSYN
jgi:hypothetical protein